MRKISFIVPVYNVEDYLDDCLKSIINIKYPNKEIILINDGSTDNSKTICKQYSLKYEYINLINKTNGGLSDARNVGIANATGEYLLFIDSDDFYGYDFTDDIIKVINDEIKKDIILFNIEHYYNNSGLKKQPLRKIDETILNNMDGTNALNYILGIEPFFGWHVVQGIFRTDLIKENNLYFINNRNYEDMLWLPEIILKADNIVYLNKFIYVYRLEREGQITSTYSAKNFIDSFYVLKYWSHKLDKKNVETELKEKLMRNFLNRYYFIIIYFQYLKVEDKNKIRKLITENKEYIYSTNSMKTKIIALSYKIFGLEITSKITYFLLGTRNIIKKLIYNYNNKN